ncbi:MAG TPA: metal ABC transporter substrate-binding protein, partial [Propionibacteriaceae bacterium]|nr:metal ABC transporter substrate-binding protein [Propionibacteriaceae bacterium]
MKGRAGGMLATLVLLVVAGCAPASPAAGGRLSVVTAFYPLQYVAEQVGGDQVSVSNLTKPGVEPHDLELTARQVASVARADLVLYEKGFQAAVDSVVTEQHPRRVLDVTQVVPLRTTPGYVGEGKAAGAVMDPHSWLDPRTMASYADAVAEELSRARPDAADAFRQRAAVLVAQLSDLDTAFATGLSSCRLTTFVTSHAAFGYLAERYGLEQVGITGLAPDMEPTPAHLAAVQKIAQ